MASAARSGWKQVKSSLADEIADRNAQAIADSAERESEMLRQMGDLFNEIGRLSRDLGVLASSVHELQIKSDAIAATLAALHDDTSAAGREVVAILGTQIEVENQSADLLGRLLESIRTRLDALEDASGAGA